MPNSPMEKPHVVGTRLTDADRAKLATLFAHAQRPASDLLRLLIRTARPVDVPPVRFDPASAAEVPCGTA